MQNQSFLTKLILKLGLAKSEKQVQPVLLAILALAIVIMFIVWSGGDSSERINPTLSVDTVSNGTYNA